MATDAQLQAQAQQQVDTEFGAQIDPLNQQIGQLQGNESGAQAEIDRMYGGLLPFVSGEADKLASTYSDITKAGEAIFNTAQQRMTQLRQGRAAEAQALAEKMGGPVAVGEFTESVLPAEQELAAVAPNSLLHTLGEFSSGVGLARAFSQRVFPLMRTEAHRDTQSYFENQIAQLRGQIDSVNRNRSTAVSNRFSDLQKAEREYQLQQAQQQLDRLKADRDWKATLRSLHNDETRISLARQQFGLDEAQTTGKYKGKPTLAAVKLSIDQQQALADMGLSQAKYQEQVRHHVESEKAANQRLALQARKNAMSIADHLTEPKTKGTVLTVTVKQKLDETAGTVAVAKGNTNVYYDPKKKEYYTYKTMHLTPDAARQRGINVGSVPVTDPKALYNSLRGAGVAPGVALSITRLKTGKKNWSP